MPYKPVYLVLNQRAPGHTTKNSEHAVRLLYFYSRVTFIGHLVYQRDRG